LVKRRCPTLKRSSNKALTLGRQRNVCVDNENTDYNMKARVIKENIYLKADFISYLQGKNLAPSSIEHYVRELGLFLAWVGKQEVQITKPDVLKYLEYLKDKRSLQNISRARVLSTLNHYFTFLITVQNIDQNPCAFIKIRGTKKQNLYRIYTPEELQTIYDNYYHSFVREYDHSYIPENQRHQAALSKQRNAVILSLLVNQGATTKQIDTLLLGDLDLMSATVMLRGSRTGKDRTLPLNATQIGVLMHYLQNIRPQLLTFHSNVSNEQLFLPLPVSGRSSTNSDSIMSVFKQLVKQLKTLDQHFVNFNQIRASVITHWIATHGLRKAQQMAGHRQISTTENYLVNDLQNLTNEINKLHPF